MLKEYLLSKKHHAYRHTVNISFDKDMSPEERMIYRFEELCKREAPVILPCEQICYLRTVSNVPDIFTKEEWDEIRKDHFIHESGYVSNLSPNYERLIKNGLLKERETANEYGKRAIDAILGLAERYRLKAIEENRSDVARVLERVPAYGAESFREALQFFRIIHFSLWLEGNYHVTVGRFDKYMYPYLKADMDSGVYDEKSALDLLCDFFLSFNKDSDLYPGVQQGDNGQSMVLGGVDRNGAPVFNLLSRLCLEASEKLRIIDPKINLRVDKNTPMEIYELGSRLTRAGLGFPQYSNDDVVISGLVKAGYDLCDARDFVVAACWEFIIPGVGRDVANIGALSFPKVVDTCLRRDLGTCRSFDEFLDRIRDEIRSSCDRLCGAIHDLWFVPSHFMDVCMDSAKYNNFGFHGTGIATATDSLYAIKKYVFEEKRISSEDLVRAVDSDFASAPELIPLLRYETPKMGMNNDEVDEISVFLLDCFAEELKSRKNCKAGIYRAGTGSAMMYLSHTKDICASPDGRRNAEPLGANFSPSLFARCGDPLSVIRSFSKQHFENAINGGPLTLEFHHSMFTDDECIKKVAMLVRSYIAMGGHQLQLNAVNADKLKDAQKHPENYRSLIVRIWGWSAYFVELDKEFQDHVISRREYVI